MPTYDYRCKACGHTFEAFQSMKDAPKRKCPRCEKNALERLIGTGGALIFKGSGFYQTDYRPESYKKAAEAETKPAAETKADSKTEPKKDAPSPSPASAPTSDKPSRKKSPAKRT